MDISRLLAAAFTVFTVSVLQFLSLLGGVVISGFLLGFLERQTNARVFRAFGLKGIYCTAWLGTPVHELSHALMCLIFHHRVTELRLLQPVDAGGTMGYVRHAYNPNSLYQQIGNLFIGVAPIIGGSLVIAFGASWLVPGISEHLFRLSGVSQYFSIFDPSTWPLLAAAGFKVFSGLFAAANYTDPYFWLFLVLALCVASRMSLSHEDIRGARSGAGALFLFLVVVNTLAVFLDPSLRGQLSFWIGRLNFVAMIMMGLSVFFSFCAFFIGWLCSAVAVRIRR